MARHRNWSVDLWKRRCWIIPARSDFLVLEKSIQTRENNTGVRKQQCGGTPSHRAPLWTPSSRWRAGGRGGRSDGPRELWIQSAVHQYGARLGHAGHAASTHRNTAKELGPSLFCDGVHFAYGQRQGHDHCSAQTAGFLPDWLVYLPH
jgi:hypothetical protein